MWDTYGKSAPVAMGSAGSAATLVAPTPGEASGDGATDMRVTSFDEGTGTIGLSYDAGCEGSDHTVYIGDLANVSAQTYSSQECFRGTSGTTSIQLGAGSQFWVVVANDGTFEGSYGKDSAGAERPDDAALATCSYTQDLSRRCDP